jgi:DNA-binding transcriptional ArsR family regulator
MVSDDPCSAPEDKRRVLLDHWEEIPAVVLIEASGKVFKSHPVREAILTVLREGIEEEQADDPERSIQRHALSPKEIKKLLGERQGIDMSQTNLYFHLNTLEKTGAIKVVTKLTEGRHRVTYYGRVAHLILPRDPEESLVTYRKLFGELMKFVKTKRPDIDAAELQGLPEEYLRVKMKKDRLMANWLSKQDPLMDREGIDGTLIYKLLKDVYSLDPENIRLLHRIADLIEADYPEQGTRTE